MLIRSWNLFHGNTVPPRATSYIEEMVRLAAADEPDVLLLQEIPAWALGRLGAWSGMAAVADVAQRPRFGPAPISARAGRALTSFNPGLLRSAFAGQGNAILLGDGLGPLAHEVLVLNPPELRKAESRLLGLDWVARLAWEKERRICQVVRAAPGLLVANLHGTSAADRRIPAAELRRIVPHVLERSSEGDTVVIGGDFNVPGQAAAIEGFSPPAAGIDHILVHGAKPSPLRTWPDERHTRGGMLLSDHAPIELDL